MAIPPTGEASRMIALAENSYGKSRVRLVKVKRHADHHDFREWTLDILLRGDFAACFVDGDNRNILPTDTMKNTVYSLARSSAAECMEEFGQELVAYFLQRNSQVSAAEVLLSEKCWKHLRTSGKPHPTTFVQASGELQTTGVTGTRDGVPSLWSGLENLVIMKTAGSDFSGFIKDSLTTLPESTDRLFGTALRCRWKYSAAARPFHALRSRIRELLLTVFAEHNSKSVQHTLYAMGEAVLKQVREIDEIQLIMPNKHCLLVDLSRFGQDNPNEIFVPVDEPHGYIEARVHRHG
ncbi:MAG: urate oxidase [Acidobacteriota bacterium]|nr:urate oxidase [Acidobacteriota bacterium]